MKCPKCGYVGFEPTDRCRHCGYDFALSVAAGASAETVAAPRPDGPVAAPVYPRPVTPPEPAMASIDAVEAPLEDLPLRGPSFFTAAERFADPPPRAGTPLAVRRTAERPRTRTTTTVTRRPRPVL